MIARAGEIILTFLHAITSNNADKLTHSLFASFFGGARAARDGGL